jgi:hypothetical protein
VLINEMLSFLADERVLTPFAIEEEESSKRKTSYKN